MHKMRKRVQYVFPSSKVLRMRSRNVPPQQEIRELQEVEMKRRRRYRGVMTNDCIVLLSWACKNGDRDVSLRVIEDETGIPDDTVRYILRDATTNKQRSLLFGVSICYGYHYYIHPEWNGIENMHRKKKIISAVKWADGAWLL